jgi:hypothetical protein
MGQRVRCLATQPAIFLPAAAHHEAYGLELLAVWLRPSWPCSYIASSSDRNAVWRAVQAAPAGAAPLRLRLLATTWGCTPPPRQQSSSAARQQRARRRPATGSSWRLRRDGVAAQALASAWTWRGSPRRLLLAAVAARLAAAGWAGLGPAVHGLGAAGWAACGGDSHGCWPCLCQQRLLVLCRLHMLITRVLCSCVEQLV